MSETKTIYQCSECGKETDYMKDASTYCSDCKKEFCFSLDQSCFISHHNKTKCKGRFRSISNPKWIINLRNQ